MNQPRFLEPPHGAAEVRAVDREHLELVAPIRRTQHAIFAVGPSQATRNGFSYVARRV